MKKFGPMDIHGDGGRWLLAIGGWRGRNRKLFGVDYIGEPVRYRQFFLFPFVLVWRVTT